MNNVLATRATLAITKTSKRVDQYGFMQGVIRRVTKIDVSNAAYDPVENINTLGAATVLPVGTQLYIEALQDADLSADLMTNLNIDSMPIRKTFSQSIVFDNHQNDSIVDQTADLNFTLASTGHLENSDYIVSIKPDGTHAIAVDENAFFLIGSPDPAQNIILHFYYSRAGIRPTCTVLDIPKFTQLSAPTAFTATPSGGSIALAWTNATNSAQTKIERSTASDFSANLTLVYTGAGTSYSDPAAGIAGGTVLYYRIHAEAYGYINSGYATAQATKAAGTTAYRFNGADQSMTVNNAGELTFAANDDWSYSFWGNLFDATGRFNIGQSTASARAIDIALTAQNNLIVIEGVITDSDGGQLYADEALPTNIAVNAYAYWTITYTGNGYATGLKIYKNGIDISATSHESSPSGVDSFAAGSSFKIGTFIGIHSSKFLLHHAFVANTALTAAEVVEAYNNGVVKDITTLSYYKTNVADAANKVIDGWNFTTNLTSLRGTHNATATTPDFA